METVSVTVKYLINFNEKTGKRAEEVSLAGGADLTALAKWLSGNYGITVPAKGVLTLLNGHGWNQHPEGMKTKLNDGDVVILMPSISGG
jgi:MoaD family protein